MSMPYALCEYAKCDCCGKERPVRELFSTNVRINENDRFSVRMILCKDRDCFVTPQDAFLKIKSGAMQ